MVAKPFMCLHTLYKFLGDLVHQFMTDTQVHLFIKDLQLKYSLHFSLESIYTTPSLALFLTVLLSFRILTFSSLYFLFTFNLCSKESYRGHMINLA